MCKLLLFAGTTEGRLLYERLSARGIEMDISVATEYGKELVEPLGGRIYAGRMSEEEMESAIRAGGYKAVIDATHPYADIVTKNIQRACRETETLYIRPVSYTHLDVYKRQDRSRDGCGTSVRARRTCHQPGAPKDDPSQRQDCLRTAILPGRPAGGDISTRRGRDRKADV